MRPKRREKPRREYFACRRPIDHNFTRIIRRKFGNRLATRRSVDRKIIEITIAFLAKETPIHDDDPQAMDINGLLRATPDPRPSLGHVEPLRPTYGSSYMHARVRVVHEENGGMSFNTTALACRYVGVSVAAFYAFPPPRCILVDN